MIKSLREIVGVKPEPKPFKFSPERNPNNRNVKDDEDKFIDDMEDGTAIDDVQGNDNRSSKMKKTHDEKPNAGLVDPMKKIKEDAEQVDEIYGKGKLEVIKKGAEDVMDTHPVSKSYERSFRVSKRNPEQDRKNLPIKKGAISTIQRVNGLISVRDKSEYADNAKDFLSDKNRRDSDRIKRKKMHLGLKNEKTKK